MKKLTKIKLINWMYFVNTTISIKGNTLISGANACGKSTIIDALQFLLMGGIRGVKFNSAANEQGKRTLEGYLRGQKSVEGQKYLRASNCIGHIAIEITDENDQSNIIGVVLEMQSNYSSVKTTFYIIEHTKLIDDYFISQERFPNSFRDVEKFSKIHGKTITRFSTTEQYRMMLKTYLGIDSQKYSRLLPNAIGVGSVTKMDDFINQFLLEEDMVEVSDLQNNIKSMQRLIDKINIDEKKLAQLEIILEKGKIITTRKEKLKVIEIAKIIARYKDYDNQIKKLQKNIEDLKKERKIKQELLVEKQEEEQRLNESVMEIRRALDNNNENIALMSLDKQLKDLEIRIEFENKRFEETRECLLKIKTCVERLRIDFDEYSTVSKELDIERGSIALIATIKDLYINFEKLKDTIKENTRILDDSLQDIICKIKNNNDNLKNLKNNIKIYPEYVTTLISNINKRLSERYGKKIEIKPLCEFVDVVDDKWRNALEGYLNTQRFDIICEPSLFDQCLEIYEEIKNKYNIFGIGIVNTNKYFNDIEAIEGTLADKITFHNKFARNYAYSLLNKVVCVDKLYELKNYENSITVTCMRYSNHVARQIQSKIYATPFLGLEANKIFINKLEMENKILNEEYTKLTDQINSLYRNLESIDKSRIEYLFNNENCLLSIDKRQELIKERSKAEKTKAELEKNPTYFALNDKLEKETKQYNTIREKVINLQSVINSIGSSIEHDEYKIDDLMDGKNESQERLRETEQENKILMPEAHKRYEESAVGKNDLQSILLSLDSAKNSYSIVKLENELTELMTHYCMTYNFGASKTYEALEYYQNEKNIIADYNLVKYKGDLEDITLKINKIFQEHFLAEIRKRIKNCNEQIDALNKQLKEKYFGDDQYKMECKPTQDSELRRYYTLIMDENYDNMGTLFADAATEKYSQDFNKMIKEITESAATGEYNRLLDYRKYLDFDIIISGKNGNRRFSDLKYIQSGGEGQVPFYIIAAVSFQNLLTQKRSSKSNLCIVLFDEAFNNMDPQRIKTMMEFYKSLNLQIFLSLTGEKIGNILEYMDTAVGLIREGDIVQTIELKREENDN